MNPLVQIAYNTINQFDLSQDLLDEVEVLRELLRNKQLYPPKDWNGYHKGIKVF